MICFEQVTLKHKQQMHRPKNECTTFGRFKILLRRKAMEVRIVKQILRVYLNAYMDRYLIMYVETTRNL